MLCERCNEREATIHYTELVNGVRSEHHICSECASKLMPAEYGSMFGADMPFARFLTGLFAAGRSETDEADDSMAHIVCPKCGMNFEEFTRVGKFGCAECYNVFGPLIDDNIRKIHGSNVHTGKRYDGAVQADEEEQPGKEQINTEEEIRLLQAKLKEAVELENYEDAALLRDRIRELRNLD